MPSEPIYEVKTRQFLMLTQVNDSIASSDQYAFCIDNEAVTRHPAPE
jgi:hypothetical protein